MSVDAPAPATGRRGHSMQDRFLDSREDPCFAVELCSREKRNLRRRGNGGDGDDDAIGNMSPLGQRSRHESLRFQPGLETRQRSVELPPGKEEEQEDGYARYPQPYQEYREAIDADPKHRCG